MLIKKKRCSLFWFNCLFTFGISGALLCGNLIFIYGNCFYDLIGFFKLDLHLTIMWLFFVFELTRGRVFGWIPWLILGMDCAMETWQFLITWNTTFFIFYMMMCENGQEWERLLLFFKTCLYVECNGLIIFV